MCLSIILSPPIEDDDEHSHYMCKAPTYPSKVPEGFDSLTSKAVLANVNQKDCC